MKNYFQFGILLISLVCNNIEISAQDYRNGFIIMNQDTINALINFGSPSQNSKRCIYKYFDISVEISKNPNQIMGYGLKNGSCFESIEINGKRLFFEYLVKGKMSLLYNGSSNNYYLKTDNSTIILLSEKKVVGKSFDNQQEMSFVNYRKVLEYYFSGCSKLSADYQTLKLEADALKEIFTQYNSCFDINFKTFERSEKSKSGIVYNSLLQKYPNFSFGLQQGILSQEITNLPLNTPTESAIEKTGKSISYFAGLFVHFKKINGSNIFCIQTEFLFNKNRFTVYSNFADDKPNVTINVDKYLDATFIKIPVLLFYGKKITNKMNVFVQAGIAKSIILKSKEYAFNQQYNSAYKEYTFSEQSTSLMRQSVKYNNLIFGLGMEYKFQETRSIFFNIRKELQSTNWGIYNSKTKSNILSLNVGINF